MPSKSHRCSLFLFTAALPLVALLAGLGWIAGQAAPAGAPLSADVPVSGTITADTIWSSANTYLVNGNVGVAPGITLTIQAGTLVKFNGSFNLNVGGKLIADGSPEQPVRLQSNTAGTSWGRIYFDTSSSDAVADAGGAYQSGSLLRYVEIRDAASGITCSGATPYLSHVSLSGGGMTCTTGATPLWLQDSSLVGNVSITGGGQVWRSTVNGGNLSLSGPATVRENTASGSLSVGAGSQVRDNTLAGSITAPGASLVRQNTAVGLTAGDGAQVIENSLSGDVYVGSSASVLTNTIRYGGLGMGSNSLARFNDILDSTDWGLVANAGSTLAYNRVIGGANGIYSGGGTILGNLVANNRGTGLEILGNVTAISNTLTRNQGSAIKLTSGSLIQIAGNNLEGNLGTYDLENLIPLASLANVPAQGNWWGTSDSGLIDGRIYDWNDGDFTLGHVLFSPPEAGPRRDAPAYVRGLALAPPSPVGLGTATFDVQFSRPMQTGSLPGLSFQSVLHNTWQVYNSSNSGLPHNEVYAIAADPNGSLWIGTGGGVAQYDLAGWTVYNSSNSGLPTNEVTHLSASPDGSHWFATYLGLSRLVGNTWTQFDITNSGLPANDVRGIYFDPDGSAWFATHGGGAAHFDGTNWTVYNATNSGLPNNYILSVAGGPDGSHWFGLYNGVARLSGDTWTYYNQANSGMPGNTGVRVIYTDPDSSYWFGTDAGGLVHFDGTNWKVYTAANTGLPDYMINDPHVIYRDPDGTHWFAMYTGVIRFDGRQWSYFTPANSGLPGTTTYALGPGPDGSHWVGTNAGVGVLLNRPAYPILDSPVWSSGSGLPGDDHYQAGYTITDLVPVGDYRITVQEASGTDRLQIAPNSLYTFTLAYPQDQTDPTPPHPALVWACAGDTPGALSATWTASDPDSPITGYRYALGSTAGGADLLAWTSTSLASFERSDLALAAGQAVYVSVQARSGGGWSLSGITPPVIAGSAACATNAFYQPQLSPGSASQPGDPGASVVYDLVVTNNGSASDTFDLSVTSPWAASGYPATLGPLAAGASANLSVTITVPAGALGGASSQAALTVTSRGNPGQQALASLTTSANNRYDVALAPAAETQSGNPGSQVTYHLVLTNTSNTSDTFDVVVTSPWTASGYPAVLGPLAAGASAGLDISIEIPATVQGGTSQQAQVVVISHGKWDSLARAVLTTQAIPSYALSLSPAAQDKAGVPGQMVAYSLLVTNQGNTSTVFSVGVTSVWTATYPATVGPLAPGASSSLTVYITIPGGAQAGTSSPATVSVSPQAKPDQQASAVLTTSTNPVYGAALTSPSLTKTGSPGTSLAYTLTVTNQSNTSVSFDVAMSSLWNTVYPSSVGPVAPGASTSFTVSVTIPAGALAGAEDQSGVTVSSQPGSAQASLWLLSRAKTVYGMGLSPASQAKSGNPGEMVPYTLQLTNQSNTQASFDVQVDGAWTTSYSPPTVWLAAGASEPVFVYVAIPSGAAAGASSQSTVVITLQADPSVHASASLVTSSGQPASVSLAPATDAKSGSPGSSVVYNLTVTNHSGSSASFDVLVTCPWSAGYPLTLGPVAPGASATLTVSIQVPAGAADGASAQATVTVSSSVDPAVQSSAVLTTSASAAPSSRSTLYLPVVRR